jgi:SAM-dependent methyltransferase
VSDAAAERTVAERWSDQRFTAELENIFWMASRWVRGHLNRRASGDPRCDWLTWFLGRYAARRRALGAKRRFLVLGCGTGWLERRLAEWPTIGAIDAQDVAEGAVRAAERKARELGLHRIHYQVANLDRDELPERAYDVVVAHSVIHHVERLERALDQIAASLRPGGVLALNEYVGPARLQYGDRALAIVNDVMARLPARYRRSAVMAGEVYPHRERPDREYLTSVDPSESVRSDEILPLLAERFEVLERRELGGAVLQPLLYDLVQNFDDDDPYDAALLRVLCALEGRLVDAGALASDYVFLVARPRGAKRPRAPRPPRPGRVASPAGAPAASGVPAAPAAPAVDWRAARAVRDHANRLPTGDPACDWPTWVAAWLRRSGFGEGEEVLLAGDGWLRAPLEHHFGRVVVAAPAELLSAPESWRGRFGAAFTSGTLWSAGPGAPELLETIRSLLRPGGHLVAHEYLGVAETARSAAAELAGALASSEAAPRIEVAAERAERDVVGEVAAIFGRDGGDLVEVLPCSGTLLELLLDDSAAAPWPLRAEASWSEDDGLLPLLCYAEERLVRDRVVAPSYVVAIARR